jgi:hypothetical protein
VKSTAIQKAEAAWGERMPAWVRALAEACGERGMRKVAARLDVSPAIISLAVNKERENLEWIKGKVEAVLMVTIVACPVLGVMGKNECEQEQARPFSGANPLRVQLYRACRNGCPHYKEINDEHSRGHGEGNQESARPAASQQRRSGSGAARHPGQPGRAEGTRARSRKHGVSEQ